VGGCGDNGPLKYQGMSALTVVVGEFKKKKQLLVST
jgi:hypothetical protein